MNEDQNNNFSYYPENISMKDGKIQKQSVENAKMQRNTSQNMPSDNSLFSNNSSNNTNNSQNNAFNIKNLLSLLGNKNLSDLLPLLLSKNNFGNNQELVSNIIGKMSKKEEEKKGKLTFQNDIEEF